ncbi:glycosyltransferase [Candidatus Skiveiella danica]|mgnify:CR=1 FL=1|uniref:glycosyltransferase n=1 Tax=Candidatus Skiveiella danica TaxID=3386177 RepID=UPI001E050DB7|nr:glycosyltransferase family 2 protein [Betaproteobacteria bacterium]
MKLPSVTISVVSHEHGDEIPNLLRDLAAFAPSSILEVIVTLNVPEEMLTKWINVRQWPFIITIINNPIPMGYGANHNQAFKFCKTPYFCIVNPDVRLTGDLFPFMISRIEEPMAGCAYPMQSNRDSEPVDLSREVPTLVSLLRRYLVPGSRTKPHERHWINGAFMLIPAPVFERLAGFDQRYFMYCEDVDICLRLQLLGYRLLPVVSVKVEHEAQHASRRRLRHLVWHVKSLWSLWHSAPYREFCRKHLRKA